MKGQVYYNYAFSIVEAEIFGKVAANTFGSEYSAFDPCSDINTVLAYGKDCTPVFLHNIPILMLASNMRPYDYQHISPFYNLAGSKMSTNKKYAIWVHDLIEIPDFSADAARAYMASRATRNDNTDISIPQIQDFFLEFQKKIALKITILAKSISVEIIDQSQFDVCIIAHAVKLCDKLSLVLNEYMIHLEKVYMIIENWSHIYLTEISKTILQRKTIAYTTAVLFQSLLPNLSNILTQALRLDTTPTYEKLRKLHRNLLRNRKSVKLTDFEHNSKLPTK